MVFLSGKVQAPSVSSVADESDNDTRITDFDAACLRARVTDASKTVLRQVSLFSCKIGMFEVMLIC
jgi:hypothetical protein